MHDLPLYLHPIAWIAAIFLVRGGVVLVRDGMLRRGPREHATFLLGMGVACIAFLAVTASPIPPIDEETLRRNLASTRLVDIALK